MSGHHFARASCVAVGGLHGRADIAPQTDAPRRDAVTGGNKPYYLAVTSSNTYADGAFTGGGGIKEMWFQVWGQ